MTTATEQIYFHGGISDLEPGELLLPPSVTGPEVGACVPSRRADRVYVTIRFDIALFYAKMAWLGDVYRVACAEPLEPAPFPESDPLRRWDFITPQATIVEVIRRKCMFVVKEDGPTIQAWAWHIIRKARAANVAPAPALLMFAYRITGNNRNLPRVIRRADGT